MIGKSISGKAFRGCCRYVLGKEHSYLLGGNMVGETVADLTTEFEAIQKLRSEIKKPVWHHILSVDTHENLTDGQWLDVIEQDLKKLGFDGDRHQYVAVRHRDRAHDHVHIVANRISYDGALFSLHNDYYRCNETTRELEEEFDFLRISDPEKRHIKRAIAQITDEVQQANEQLNVLELCRRLERHSIQSEVIVRRGGGAWGIAYYYEDQRYPGSELGKEFTLPGLSKHKGIAPTDIAQLQEAGYTQRRSHTRRIPTLSRGAIAWMERVQAIAPRLRNWIDQVNQQIDNDFTIRKPIEFSQLRRDLTELAEQSRRLAGGDRENQRSEPRQAQGSVHDPSHTQHSGDIDRADEPGIAAPLEPATAEPTTADKLAKLLQRSVSQADRLHRATASTDQEEHRKAQRRLSKTVDRLEQEVRNWTASFDQQRAETHRGSADVETNSDSTNGATDSAGSGWSIERGQHFNALSNSAINQRSPITNSAKREPPKRKSMSTGRAGSDR